MGDKPAARILTPGAALTVVGLVLLLELNPIDNGLLDAQQGSPYPGVAHAVPRS
jgi:hypothetical protein